MPYYFGVSAFHWIKSHIQVEGFQSSPQLTHHGQATSISEMRQYILLNFVTYNVGLPEDHYINSYVGENSISGSFLAS